MKEKIGQFARGIFEYTSPGIVLSADNINQGIDMGKNYYGSFIISNTASSVIKGVIYSSNDMVITDVDSFAGRACEIKYCVRSSQCMSGEIIKGRFMLVTNCGEIDIPYNFVVEKPVFETSFGDIKDLFQFANLAKVDDVEALKIFSSPQFENIFLSKDVKYSLIYNTLMKNRNLNIAMEEFLVAVHKKSPVNICVEKKKMEYVVTNEEFRDKIEITKDTWGYCEVTLRSEGDGISLTRDKLTSDDFIGNRAVAEFIVHPDNIRVGKNYGRIIIESIGNRIDIEIICQKPGTQSQDISSNRLKSFQCRFLKNYINFRAGRISLDKYVADSEILINNMCILTDTGINDLLKIHLMLISGRNDKATQLLETFRENLENTSVIDELNYCGYMYLKSLIEQNSDDLDKAVETTRQYYDSTCHTWQILWLLLYMDKRYDSNFRLVYTDIKEQFELGCTSPVLYYEACSMFLQDLALLEQMGRFETQIMFWGAKNDLIPKKMAINIANLCVKLKDYNPLIYRLLELLYKKYTDNEILTAICVQLIKGQKTDNKYFPWYRQGVEKQLKITQLHEFYMYSYDEESKEPFPASLLLYFSYNSSLSDRKKAFLYATIIKNKAFNYPTYKNYKKIIERFMIKQIKAHIINENLKVIYEEFLDPSIIDDEIAADLPYILFRYDICCYNPNFKGIIVVNKMIEKEFYSPFVEGRAQVNLFTDDCEIFLVDKDDNRYVRSNSYVMKKLLNSEMYIEPCYEHNMTNDMLVLHIASQIDSMSRENSFNVNARKRLLDIAGLRKEYERKCQYNLIQYCYDNRELELLDAYLSQIDVDLLSPRERSYIVEYLILRDFYEKALIAVDKYGFGVVPAKRLQRLARSVIDTNYDNEQTRGILCAMCIHVFRQGRVDVQITQYLARYYNGSTKEMLAIWKACNEAHIECTEFEERLLGQILFAESYSMDCAKVFESYYEKGTDKRLIKAFLKYNAYKYLVRDRVVPQEIFDIMARELSLDKNEMCALAMLKYYSTLESLDKNQEVFSEYYINYFSGKNIVLPFFKNFMGKVELPGYISDKYYVEYKADPAINISIHYQIDDDAEFVVEQMKDVYMGIRVKEFMLFYGDTLQYYVSEESIAGDKITESFNISITDNNDDDKSRFGKINTMLMAREMKDESTVVDMMKDMVEQDYLAHNLFEPVL